MNKKTAVFAAVISAAMVCGCSKGDSSSQTMMDIMSEANEINDIKTDEDGILPEAVSFDSDRMTELEADDEGVINCKEMGVAFHLPSQYKACFYSIGDLSPDEWKKTVNPSCTHSLFLISPYYPQATEYVRISVDRLVSPMTVPYDVLKKNDGKLTEAQYLSRIKSDIKLYTSVLAAYEDADIYNYIGAKSKEGYISVNDMVSGNIDNGTLAMDMIQTTREKAPNSEISKISSEFIELENGCFGVKLDYTLTRYGTKTAKEVYWLYCKDSTLMRRIEFTKDISAGTSLDTKAFLEDMQIFDPDLPEGNLCYGFETIWEQTDTSFQAVRGIP